MKVVPTPAKWLQLTPSQSLQVMKNALEFANAVPRKIETASHAGNFAVPWAFRIEAISKEEILMRTLLLASFLAVAGFAFATPISVAPASAQVAVDTPIGGVRVGPQPRYDRDYDRRAYRGYGYDRRYRSYGYDRGYRGCRTVTIERDDGSVRRVRRCG
jgi:hypothetical protein